MTQTSLSASHQQDPSLVTSGDYSQIDFYGIVDGHTDLGNAASQPSITLTELTEHPTLPAGQPHEQEGSQLDRQIVLTVSQHDAYFHLQTRIKNNTTYQILAQGLTVTYSYLSECPDILDRGIALVNLSSGSGKGGIPEKYQSQTTTHAEPPYRWMNDPNGFCRFQGRYHLFYQFNPFGWTWGPMHWGHMVSKDLVHWTHLPIALGPQQEEIYADSSYAGGAFSGSAIPVDGQGHPCRGDDAQAICFFLTYHLERLGDATHQVEYQATCTSTDGIHLSQSTVIINRDAPGLAVDFRDPKIDLTALQSGPEAFRGQAVIVAATNLPADYGEKFRQDQGVDQLDEEHMSGDQGWFATKADLERGREKAAYSTIPAIVAYTARPNDNLSSAESWHYAGPLLMDYQHGVSKTFECPDVFDLDGQQIVVGALMHYRDRGGRFQPVRWYAGKITTQARPAAQTRSTASTDVVQSLHLQVGSSGWCDSGDSYYAFQSFVDDSGRRIAIGWVADWYGIRNPETSTANGLMTYPRQLHYSHGRLISHPVEEVYQELLGQVLPLSSNGDMAEETGKSYYADLHLQPSDKSDANPDFDLVLASKGECSLHLLRQGGEIRLATQGLPTDRLKLALDLPAVERLEVFMDGTVCELFANSGEEAATVLFDNPHGSGTLAQTGFKIVSGREAFVSLELRAMNL